MIARWIGTIPAGRVSYHEWAHWDMLPTLTELAGAKTPAGIDGMSMARALTGQPQPTHEFMYWEFHERGFQQAVRMGHWKAVRLKKDAPLELYDLPDDPTEQHNIAAGNPDVVAKIEKYSRRRGPSRNTGPIKYEGPRSQGDQGARRADDRGSLLSPANCGGTRGRMVMSERATFDLAVRLRRLTARRSARCSPS